MNKRLLVVLATGFEEIETVAPIDILNRAGVEVTIASLTPGPIQAAYGVRLVTDTTVSDVSGLYDGIMFPGGRANARALAADAKVRTLAMDHFQHGKLVSAICAAPGHLLAEATGILRGRRATGDPAFNDKLAAAGATITDQLVTRDDLLVTGMGPGAAMPFGLMLAEVLAGKETADSFASKWRITR